jgi:hypothetical protein
MFDNGQNKSKAAGVCIPVNQPSTNLHGKPHRHRETATATSPSNWAWSQGHGHFDWMDSYAPFLDVNHNDFVL